MTISSEVRKAGPYSGNDVATSFPFAFKVFSASDVVAILTDPAGAEKTLVVGIDYSVALNADQDASPGGTVKKTSALARNYLLTITSSVPNLQPLDLTNQGGFYPRVINAALDRLTILVQQTAEQVGRAVKVGISSNVPPDDLINDIKQSTSNAEKSAVEAAASAKTASNSAKRAEEAASGIENLVPMTSPLGAAILPEGKTSDRPVVIPNTGLVMRGSITSGVPEYYSRQVRSWIEFGIPTFLDVPNIFCGWHVLVNNPHIRYFVWDGNRYVRAPWHQPGKLSYFLRDVPSGSIEVRADIVWRTADLPDLAKYLGVTSPTFVLDENRGEFLRTLDSGRGSDPGRTPGSWQSDEIRAHTHLSGDTNQRASGVAGGATIGSGNNSTHTSAFGGVETRGRNVAYRLAATY